MKAVLRVSVVLMVFFAGVGLGVLVVHKRAESWRRAQEARWVAEFDRLSSEKAAKWDEQLALTKELFATQDEVARLRGDAPTR